MAGHRILQHDVTALGEIELAIDKDGIAPEIDRHLTGVDDRSRLRCRRSDASKRSRFNQPLALASRINSDVRASGRSSITS